MLVLVSQSPLNNTHNECALSKFAPAESFCKSSMMVFILIHLMSLVILGLSQEFIRTLWSRVLSVRNYKLIACSMFLSSLLSPLINVTRAQLTRLFCLSYLITEIRELMAVLDIDYLSRRLPHIQACSISVVLVGS